MVKNPPANAGDLGLIPRLVRFPGKGNGNSFQYSCLGNPMDRGAWWDYRPPSTEELDTTEPLNNNGNNKHTEREPPPASVVNFSHGLNGSSFLYSAFFLILAL